MSRRSILPLSFILLGVAVTWLPSCGSNSSPASPAATDTPTFTATLAASFTPTPTPTNTAAATATSTGTATASSTPSFTATLTATSTATASFTPNVTATNTPTGTATGTFTDSPTDTPTDTATVTPTCFMGAAPTIAGDYNTSGYAVFLFPYQAPSTGNIYGMTGEVLSTGGSSFYQFGVYADDGSGNPTHLLGSTPIISLPTSAAFDIQSQTFGSPIAITAGNTYWLAFLGNVALYSDLSTAGQFKQIYVAGGPTPMPSSPAPASITGLATGQAVYYLYASTCP